MATPLDPANLDHAIELYLAGEPLEKIPAAAGVSVSRLHRERIARGIPPRKLRVLPEEQIVRQYLAGASEFGLSQQYGVSRGPITRILTNAGIQRRGMSEAGEVRNRRMSAEERKLQVLAANRAARGRSIGQREKARKALEKEARGLHESEGETLIAGLLSERGVAPIAQRAVGVYNVDLALVPVAVEIVGGSNYPSRQAIYAERTPYILDEGWHLVLILDDQRIAPLGAGAADYIVAFLDEVRRNPPATSQYRVISGDGEVHAARGREDDEFPLVPATRSRLGRGA